MLKILIMNLQFLLDLSFTGAIISSQYRELPGKLGISSEKKNFVLIEGPSI